MKLVKNVVEHNKFEKSKIPQSTQESLVLIY